jgi:hypothetical protein
MKKEQIKFAFLKVKQDILDLEREMFNLRKDMDEIKDLLYKISKNIEEKSTPTHPTDNPTETVNPTDSPTVPKEIGGLKNQNLGISIGNEGVPTDKQTDSPTDIPTDKIKDFTTFNLNQINSNKNQDTIEINIQKASEILESLDQIKKEIRRKFKKVTPQEMAVFSTIYQLEEQKPDKSTYKDIALILRLSESSIRDYVHRMINKGIPIKKEKLNNKKAILSISPELKKIVTLSTIIQLREL